MEKTRTKDYGVGATDEFERYANDRWIDYRLIKYGM